MAIGSIMSTSLSALQANQAALRVASNNVSNVNTEGYTRVETRFASRSSTGGIYGVEVDIQRVADQYLAAAEMRASSNFAAQEVTAGFLDRAQGLMGDPSDGGSVFSTIDAALDAFGSLSIDPSDNLRRADVVSSMSSLVSQLDQTGSEIIALRQEADSQLSAVAGEANNLMDTIAQLNASIQRSAVAGGDSTEAETQQSRLIDSLSELMDIRIDTRPTGGVIVRTIDGLALVDSQAATISVEQPTTGDTFGRLMVRQPRATADIDLESHLSGGQLFGLIKARDVDLAELGAAFGEYAAGVVNAFNAEHNDSTAVPAPQTLTGTNTGWLDSDAHGFTGIAHLAFTDANGTLSERFSIDFDTGTITNSAGATVANMGANATIGGLETGLTTALSGRASVDFSQGRMTIAGLTTNDRISIRQDETTPSDKAGKGFSHAFGLNNLIGRDTPLSSLSGLTSTSQLSMTNGENIVFEIRDREGGFLRQAQVTIDTATMSTVGDVLTSLNSEISTYGSLTIDDANGRISFTPNPNTNADTLDIVIDTTQRGDTGLSFSHLFGMGSTFQARRAQGLEVRPDIVSNLSNLAAARPDIATATTGLTLLGSRGWPRSSRVGESIQPRSEFW